MHEHHLLGMGFLIKSSETTKAITSKRFHLQFSKIFGQQSKVKAPVLVTFPNKKLRKTVVP